MAFCDDPTDPAHMTPEQRVEEIAAILAAGLLRLRQRVAVPAPCPPSEISADSAQNCLDDSSETRLHGHRG
jgi:hypothetical protein